MHAYARVRVIGESRIIGSLKHFIHVRKWWVRIHNVHIKQIQGVESPGHPTLSGTTSSLIKRLDIKTALQASIAK